MNTTCNSSTITNTHSRVVTVVMAVSALVFSIMAWNIPQVNTSFPFVKPNHH